MHQRLANQLLRVPQAATCNHERACLREKHAAFAVYRDLRPLRTAAPVLDDELIAGTEHVIRADWNI